VKRLRLPPRIKVLEAAGAIGDGRVEVWDDDGGVWRGRVVSSTGERVYRVAVLLEDGRGRAYSDDNGTRLRGYVGYPIIAVLMLKGVLPRDPEVERALAGVAWKRLNEKYKRYWLVEKIVAGWAEKKGVSRDRLEEFVSRGLDVLGGLELYYDEGLASSSSRRVSPSS